VERRIAGVPERQVGRPRQRDDDGLHELVAVAERVERERDEDEPGHHHQQRRDEPARPPYVEATEVDAAGAVELVEEQPGDQVAGEREEHDDPDHARTLERLGEGVPEHHQADRDPAEQVDPVDPAGHRWAPRTSSSSRSG
jgi:hypothetical protein